MIGEHHTDSVFCIDVAVYYRRLRSILDECMDDGFKSHKAVMELIPAVLAHMFDWRQPTPYSLVDKLRLEVKEHGDVMRVVNLLLEFIHTEARNIPIGWTYTGAELTEETLNLVASFETPNLREYSFEQYIDHCRRSGEYLHPDLDRLIREFRSLGSETDSGNPVSLLRPRRIFSKTW